MSSQRSVDSPQIEGMLVIVSYWYYDDNNFEKQFLFVSHLSFGVILPLIEFIYFQQLKGDLNAFTVSYRHELEN